MSQKFKLMCAWCGKVINGHTYIIQRGYTWCSELCWNAWHRDKQRQEDASRWEDDGGR